MEEYLHSPYEFESKEKIDEFIKKAKDQTFFSLYKKAKSIVSKYIDQEEHAINLIAVDIIFSYFQDRFSTTHYVGIFGENESGKSSIGDVVEALAYRAVNTTDPTQANIYRSLGSIEAGQITLVLDESEKIDKSDEMMAILKTGYDIKKLVSRINQYSGKPEKFHTYCYKLIIGEKPPGINKAKGVLDRTFQLTTFYGIPSFNIKEVLNPTSTGGDELKQLLNEIMEFRNLLFIYRLVHFRDVINNIDIELTGRNNELVKPCLQLFSNPVTEEDKKMYFEIKNTFIKLLKLKSSKKDFTIEAAFLPIITKLMQESRTKTVTFSDFWEELKRHITGKQDEKKPNEFHTEEFGTIYRNSISDKLQKLGVDTKRHNRYTELIFNRRKIMKNLHQYNISIQTGLANVNEDKDGEKWENKSEHCERCED